MQPLRSCDWPDNTLSSLPLWGVVEELTAAYREKGRLERLLATVVVSNRTDALVIRALVEQRQQCEYWERAAEELKPRYEPELRQRIETLVLVSTLNRED